MHVTQPIPRPTRYDMIAALALYLGITALSLWLGAPATAEAALGSAAVTAAGTLAMGWLAARRTAYPRWGMMGAAAALAVGALLGPFIVADPVDWATHVRPMLWTHPWVPMMLAWTPPKSRQGICSPTAPWAGWMLIGGGVLMALLTYGAALLAVRI